MFELLQSLLKEEIVRLTETQKRVLCNIFVAPTPRLAYEYTIGDEYKTDARLFLLDNGIVAYTSDELSDLTITSHGEELMKSLGLLDEMTGDLTDYGKGLVEESNDELQ